MSEWVGMHRLACACSSTTDLGARRHTISLQLLADGTKKRNPPVTITVKKKPDEKCVMPRLRRCPSTPRMQGQVLANPPTHGGTLVGS